MNVNIITRCLLHQSFTSRVLVRTFMRSHGLGFSSCTAMCGLHSRTMSAQLSKVPLRPTQSSLASTQDKLSQIRHITADTQTTSLTIWEDIKQMRFSPIPALGLGFAGLIPFMAPPAYMMFSQAFCANLALAQTAYGACILSFLGGVRWGFVLPEGGSVQADWFNLGYSVTPSLVAWGALLLPSPFSSIVIMTGLAGLAYFDTAFKGYPPWFKGLRFILSLGAVLSLWSVFLCQFLLRKPEDKAALTKNEQGLQEKQDK